MKCLVVIDVQNDFVTGSLGTAEAVEMLPRLREKMRSFEGAILMTIDTHEENYLDTQEGRMLPVKHCIMGTEGWRFPEEVNALRESRGARIYAKPTFGSEKLVADLKRLYESDELESVELVGLCTDICVISNALLLKAFLPEVKLTVDASCCAGVTPESHQRALEAMKACQIEVVNGEQT